MHFYYFKMGTLFSSSKTSKARAVKGRDFGWSSDHSHSTTKVAIVFWKHPKNSYFAKDDFWPLIFFNSVCYEGELGQAGVIDTPWLHELLSESYYAPPQGIIGAVTEPPTMRLQAYCRTHHYSVKFTTQADPKRGDLILAEVSRD